MSTGRSFTLDAWVCGQNTDETQTRAALRYEPAMPWSVRFVVKHDDCCIVRHISRDMLREGFVTGHDAAGIQIRPDSNATMIEFVVPVTGDTIYTRVPRVELALVVEKILKMVPVGEEATRFDWTAGMEHCEADAA